MSEIKETKIYYVKKEGKANDIYSNGKSQTSGGWYERHEWVTLSSARGYATENEAKKWLLSIYKNLKTPLSKITIECRATRTTTTIDTDVTSADSIAHTLEATRPGLTDRGRAALATLAGSDPFLFSMEILDLERYVKRLESLAKKAPCKPSVV